MHSLLHRMNMYAFEIEQNITTKYDRRFCNQLIPNTAWPIFFSALNIDTKVP